MRAGWQARMAGASRRACHPARLPSDAPDVSTRPPGGRAMIAWRRSTCRPLPTASASPCRSGNSSTRARGTRYATSP
eukprot:414592-Prymnesium_polylepis.1